MTEISSASSAIHILGNSSLIGSLLFSCLMAALISFTYWRAHSDMSHDRNYSIMLVMLVVVTTLLMQVVQSNIALSIGILGSLSLVCFRTNIKDPCDLGFVFWAMGIGLSSITYDGWIITVLGSLILAVLLIFTGDRHMKADDVKLLVIRGSQADTDLITQIIENLEGKTRLKAQSLLADSFELVYEIKIPTAEEQRVAKAIMQFPGVDTVNLLAPSAELV